MPSLPVELLRGGTFRRHVECENCSIEKGAVWCRGHEPPARPSKVNAPDARAGFISMKCVTCGKTVKKGEAVCAFCGAMTGEPAPKAAATQPGEFHLPTLTEKKSTPAKEHPTE